MSITAAHIKILIGQLVSPSRSNLWSYGTEMIWDRSVAEPEVVRVSMAITVHVAVLHVAALVQQ